MCVMTPHLNLAGTHGRNPEQQQEIREAKRILKDKVRSDWEYGPLPQHTSSGRPTNAGLDNIQDRIAGFDFHTSSILDNHGAGVLGLDFDPIEWCERHYSSDSEDEQGADGEKCIAKKIKRKIKGEDKDDAATLEKTESVDSQAGQRRQARKRKRQQLLREEVQWNDGLAHWLQRRDVWCGARNVAEVQMVKSSAHSSSTASSQSDSSSPRTSTSSAVDSTLTPNSSLAATPELDSTTNLKTIPPTSTASEESLSSGASNNRSVTLDGSHSDVALADGLPEVMIPIAPSILPDHPIRQRITANTYPEIYSKIIIQSRTPSIPINLQTLTSALVAGWKADDEWPPKPGILEKSIGRRKHHVAGCAEGTLKHGVKAVGRALRIVHTGESSTKGT